MPRINGEMCRAVELLIAPDIAEFSTVGERLTGFDLEPDNSHCTPPINALDIFIINPRLVLADRGEQKEGTQPEEPKNDKARPFF
jgi:hypothetical protein